MSREHSTDSSRNRRSTHASVALAYVVVAMAIVLATLLIVVFYHSTPDDTFISLRYADNLRSGFGAVYNAGERVEGYSNPMIVALAALAMFLGLDGVTTLKILGIVAFSMTCAMIVGVAIRSSSASGPRAIAVLAGAVIVFPAFGMTFYASSGMETVVLAVTVLGLVLVSTPDHRWRFAAWPLVTACALLRPEGMLYALVPLSALWFGRGSPNARRDIVRHTAWATIGFVLPIAIAAIARFTYYDAWLPNTFWAKLPWTQGRLASLWLVRGFDDIAVFSGVTLLPVLAGLLALTHHRHGLSTRAKAAITALATGLLFQKYAGGDWMLGARFMVPLIPVAGVLWIEALSAWTRKLSDFRIALRAVAAAGVLVLLGHANAALEFWLDRELYPRNVMTSEGLDDIGLFVRDRTPEHWKVVNARIGAIGYYGNRHVIDTLGLVSREIAQIRARSVDPSSAEGLVAEYVERQRPEIQIRSEKCSPAQLLIGSLKYVRVLEASAGDEEMQVYVLESALHEMRGQPRAVGVTRPSRFAKTPTRRAGDGTQRLL